MFKSVIGELEITDSFIFKKLVDLKDCRANSKGLRLKLTEENIETLIQTGAIGLPSNWDTVQDTNPIENVPVIAQPSKGSCFNSSVSCAKETFIGELELSDLSKLDKLLDLNDSRVTSKGLDLKLTDESIKVLIESGVIGIPSDTYSDMNGLLSDFSDRANGRNVKRKGRLSNLEMPCDKSSTVIERKHRTRKGREGTSPSSSQHNAENSTPESSKQGKQPLKSKIPPELPKPLPVKKATRSTVVRRGKRLAVCKSSEDEDNDSGSPSKVSVTIGMVEIKSPVAKLQTSLTASEPNNKDNTTNALKVASKNGLICDTDDFKTTSESEPSDSSLRNKRSKNRKVSFKPNSPNGNHAGIHQQKLTKFSTLTQSSSEISEEDNILARAEPTRTENCQSEFTGSNIQSILQRYKMKPDVLAQNMDINALSSFWEQAGPDAHLVVLLKQDANRRKPCYSLAIVTD